MKTDKAYCASSFLMYRTVYEKELCFGENYPPVRHYPTPQNRTPIADSDTLLRVLKEKTEAAAAGGKAALALSGGIDSAILAKFMPKGSVAYTFKCVVPGMKVTDESGAAAKYAAECGLEHRIIEVTWEDIEQLAPVLMAHKGAPIHSIEVQIYKAALQVKADGFDTLVFGESSDVTFGGMSGLLSKDWLYGDFLERYAYVMPYKVLKEARLETAPVIKHEKDGFVDPHAFCSTEFYEESLNSYYNATDTAGVRFAAPFSECIMSVPIDYDRIRSGENKYLVREVFNKLYDGFAIPPKLPMPRATNEWLRDWQGPVRHEFYPHCTDEMTGDQKWLVWSLERFMNMYEAE